MPVRGGEVVRTGAQLPALLGEAPRTLVAFAYTGSWTQVPVQVDEREWLDIMVAYGGRNFSACTAATCGEGVGAVSVLEYTDPNTLVGADSNAKFDQDDELVFMARFAGRLAPSGSHPSGVVATSRTAVPVDGGVVYLYVDRSGRNPAAGADLVDHRFALARGTFPSAYDFEGGTITDFSDRSGESPGSNPERTFVQTDAYQTTFLDRWIQDGLYAVQGGGFGPDLIDRYKFQFAPGVCGRSEWTGSAGRGTIVAAIDGPVRGIRVVRGFNSGPLTTRTTYFYERDIVVMTDLRVHDVPALLDIMDYDVPGATYDDPEHTGLTIDARPDNFREASRAPNRTFWNLVNSGSGSVATALRLATDLPRLSEVKTYYAEGQGVYQCTGDEADRGTSGIFVKQQVANTDPFARQFWTVVGMRRIRVSGQPISRAEAAALANGAFAGYGPTPMRRTDGQKSAGGGVPPVPPPDGPAPPPPGEDPPGDDPAPPPSGDGADLAIEYDGTTVTITNLGPETSTGAVGGYEGASGFVSRDLPRLAPGQKVSTRVSGPSCLVVRAGDQSDPDTGNNRACASARAATANASMPAMLSAEAYPNPFNPATTISYELPAAGAVSVTVYDALGRQVATLVDGAREAGFHTARFDATDLASGLYLYRVETEQGSTTGRMMLLK